MDSCLKQIVRAKCEKKYEEAIKMALLEYKKTKSACFLNEAFLCYKKQNKQKEALKILKKMLKSDPNSSYLLQVMAFELFCMGNFKEALKYYKKIFTLEPYSSKNCFNVGCCFHYLNNAKKAQEFYSKAIKYNPNNISAINNLGLLCYENKNTEYALKFFEQAIQKAPKNPEAYHHKGIIYREFIGDFRMSELYIKKAILLDKLHAENYYELALTYQKQNKIKLAIVALGKCLELKPWHKPSVELFKKLNSAAKI